MERAPGPVNKAPREINNSIVNYDYTGGEEGEGCVCVWEGMQYVYLEFKWLTARSNLILPDCRLSSCHALMTLIQFYEFITSR